MRSLNIRFQNIQYPVYVGRGLLSNCARLIENLKARSCLIVTDDNVKDLYAETVRESLAQAGAHTAVFSVPSGEESKSSEWLGKIYDSMLDLGLTRSDLVIALGGGVVGDLTGYASATFLRGVPYVQIPTTLLAQVDSSVGGKVAINLSRGKNLVGAFYNPTCVIADSGALSTLNNRQFLCGLAEAIKYGAICDKELFDLIGEGLGGVLPNLDEIICRCINHKADYVLKDPLDAGARMELNFGHTLGHALENAAGYGAYTHGEAISVGMAQAARWGELMGISKSGVYERIKEVEISLGLPVSAPLDLVSKSLRALKHDKKTRGDTINLVLLEDIGRAKITPVKLGDLILMAGVDAVEGS